MFAARFDSSVFQDVSWWHWALAVPLLAAHLMGVEGALGIACVLCVVSGGYFFSIVRAWRPYPVQLRLAYLAMLVGGTLPFGEWLHWLQLVGTTAMVTVGYCLLARVLNLLSWNRSEPLTWALVKRSLFRDPCVGGLVAWGSQDDEAVACCSLRNRPQPQTCSLRNTHNVERTDHYANAH